MKYKFLLWREVWRNQRTWPGLRTAGADGKRLLHFTWAIIQGKGKNWFVIHLGNAKQYSTQSFVSQLHTLTWAYNILHEMF